MVQPLATRRKRLREHVHALRSPAVIMSEGIQRSGISCFREAEQQGLEGVMAKLLRSRYTPGRRSDAWIKIKRQLILPCVVIGFVPKGKDDFESLLIAAQDAPELPPRYVGRVGGGFSTIERAQVNQYLWGNICRQPLVEAKQRGEI